MIDRSTRLRAVCLPLTLLLTFGLLAVLSPAVTAAKDDGSPRIVARAAESAEPTATPVDDDGGDDMVAVAPSFGYAPAGASTELAVPSGVVNISSRVCPAVFGYPQAGAATVAELSAICQEAPVAFVFTLDYGYWAGSQSVGEVILGGVYWGEVPLSAETFTLSETLSYQWAPPRVFCGADHLPDWAEVPVVAGAIDVHLTPAIPNLICLWFNIPAPSSVPDAPVRTQPTGYVARGGGGADGAGCPDGHHWTDERLEFEWYGETVVARGGCVPDSGTCPEGSAIHPFYTEYGCIPYGQGPWTT